MIQHQCFWKYIKQETNQNSKSPDQRDEYTYNFPGKKEYAMTNRTKKSQLASQKTSTVARSGKKQTKTGKMQRLASTSCKSN